MRTKILSLCLFICSVNCFGQAYETLKKLDNVSNNVYYSDHAKNRALKIASDVAKAAAYFQQQFSVKPNYTLLVLNPSDWKQYAHPQAIYGIPHYLADGRLIVASENNDFWKNNTPAIDKLSASSIQLLQKTYAKNNKEIDLSNAFDLLAIHELGHAFQKAGNILIQRNWLNELYCNVLLHTYLAEKDPKQLPFITVFTQLAIAATAKQAFKYTGLKEFDENYNLIAQKHPDNYGWYQCRLHVVAGEIYDEGGVKAMKDIWNALSLQKTKLNDDELREKIIKSHPALERAFVNWDK